MKKKKLKIGLVYGGTSAEREVSLSTAREIKKTLNKDKYIVVPIEIAKDGSWPKTIKIDQLKKKIDIAFIAMHGPQGEDGTMQGFFETLGIPHTFSGVLASSLAMDKYRVQQFLSPFNIPFPRTIALTKYQFNKDKGRVLKSLASLGDNVVVKPNRLGSSVGVYKAATRSKQELIKALHGAFKYEKDVIVQKYIAGKEITASVLGNEQAKNLPLVEIVPTAKGSTFYDYAAKYETGGSEHIIPAKISKHVYKAISDMALQAHLLLGCDGVSRSDFIVTADHEIYYLETNTIPGMTATSLLPQAAAKAGISFERLLDLIIQLAQHR